jgi:DNA repair exonuclease SbcCD ATPase subunit
MTCLCLRGQGLYSRQQPLDRVLQNPLDIDDDGILKRTLYGTLRPDEISLDQSERMVEAARRRVARVEERMAEIQPLIEAGVLARNEIKAFHEELEYRKKTLALAESRQQFLKELAEMARAETVAEPQDDSGGVKPAQERFDGNGQFGQTALKRIVLAYEKQFAKAIPISANGETAFHRALGYNHSGRVDIALSPDTTEGVWLRQFLEKEQIPYYAFRTAISGKASAPHIHIGPPSTRLRVAD